jgi:hypothetical protein
MVVGHEAFAISTMPANGIEPGSRKGSPSREPMSRLLAQGSDDTVPYSRSIPSPRAGPRIGQGPVDRAQTGHSSPMICWETTDAHSAQPHSAHLQPCGNRAAGARCAARRCACFRCVRWRPDLPRPAPTIPAAGPLNGSASRSPRPRLIPGASSPPSGLGHARRSPPAPRRLRAPRPRGAAQRVR